MRGRVLSRLTFEFLNKLRRLIWINFLPVFFRFRIDLVLAVTNDYNLHLIQPKAPPRLAGQKPDGVGRDGGKHISKR
jgi:hypothetical protein